MLKKILKRSHGGDMNHALGYAADIYLVRNIDGEQKNVCLYDPNDDDDFKITQFFIKTCFNLGANNVGAGIDYMAYPKPHRYGITTKNVNTIKSLDENTKKFKGRIVLDERGVPLRPNGKKYNGFHIDIINQSQIYEDFNLLSGEDTSQVSLNEIFKYANPESIKKLEKKLENKTVSLNPSDGIASRVKFKNNLSIKKYKPTSKHVWGNQDTISTADTWLREIINSRANSGIYNVKSIEKETAFKILLEQVKDRYGNENKKSDEGSDELNSDYLEKFKYVEWEDIKK